MKDRNRRKQKALVKKLQAENFSVPDLLEIFNVKKNVLLRWVKKDNLLPRECSFCSEVSTKRFFSKKAKNESFCSLICRRLREEEIRKDV